MQNKFWIIRMLLLPQSIKIIFYSDFHIRKVLGNENLFWYSKSSDWKFSFNRTVFLTHGGICLELFSHGNPVNAMSPKVLLSYFVVSRSRKQNKSFFQYLSITFIIMMVMGWPTFLLIIHHNNRCSTSHHSVVCTMLERYM